MPCRFCTTNDEEALIEELAARMWASCETSDPVTEWTKDWDAAGPHWQFVFRNYARTFLSAARRDHDHDG